MFRPLQTASWTSFAIGLESASAGFRQSFMQSYNCRKMDITAGSLTPHESLPKLGPDLVGLDGHTLVLYSTSRNHAGFGVCSLFGVAVASCKAAWERRINVAMPMGLSSRNNSAWSSTFGAVLQILTITSSLPTDSCFYNPTWKTLSFTLPGQIPDSAQHLGHPASKLQDGGAKPNS